uniref:RNA polymerase, sigma-24 subunit, ECF subfamily n=1 Tax=Caulobacter sp. (strain K31) TaxID=366602 RepID=B0T4G9_CAUSK
MARLSRPWPLVVSQWWRWRHPDLWRGRVFDPHNAQQVMSYAVLHLRRETRDVFLLNHIEALDYALIARHLGLSVADVQARLADALCELSRTVDLIERIRPKPFNLSNAEHPDV